jgi:hypothetical protein
MHAHSPQAALAALILLGLAVAAPAAAATVAVTNCNDHGTGSLRNAAAVALDDDLIDLRGLACTRILLTSGPILFEQAAITVQGPGRGRLAIDGGGHSAVLRHDPPGRPTGRLLRVRDLTVRWGRLYDPVLSEGGCVYSGANVTLERVNVHHCVASGARAIFGAGVYSGRNLRLINAQVYENRAVLSAPDAYAFGGGAYGAATVLLDHSRLCDNEAQFAGGGWSNSLTAIDSTVSHNVGGGFDMGAGTVDRSTFSHNAGYGLAIHDGRVANSTFSSNLGPGLTGGGVQLLQNTIAFNRTPRIDGVCGAGLSVGSGFSQLRGNLVARNTCDGIPLDYTHSSESTIYFPSEGNLIMYAGSSVPPETLNADPHLLPLADNGGPTLTHALPADSPAIDRGSEADVGLYDQRDVGFLRTVNGIADIGAFERQRP